MTVLSWGKIEEYWYFIHADEFMVCKSLLSHQLCKYVETVHVVSVMIVIDFMDHISGSEIYLHRFSKSLNCVKDRWHTTLTSRCLQRVLILQHRITEHLRLEGTSGGFWSSLLLKAGPLCGNTRVSRAPASWVLKRLWKEVAQPPWAMWVHLVCCTIQHEQWCSVTPIQIAIVISVSKINPFPDKGCSDWGYNIFWPQTHCHCSAGLLSKLSRFLGNYNNVLKCSAMSFVQEY